MLRSSRLRFPKEKKHISCAARRAARKKKRDPQALFPRHGRGSGSSGEKPCQRPIEGSLQDGAQTGTDSGASSPGERSVRTHVAETPGVRLNNRTEIPTAPVRTGST